mmetsp:Transcript_9896/g.26893  ORF Transcript_9896/g.26893 Transcript_9896/m.26893 type:complete len:359 (-) Transcript_9896:394-1470(-)
MSSRVVAVVALDTGGGTFSCTRIGPMTMPPPMPHKAARIPAKKLQRTNGKAKFAKSSDSVLAAGRVLSLWAKWRANPRRLTHATATTAHHVPVQMSRNMPLATMIEHVKTQRQNSLTCAPRTWASASASASVILDAETAAASSEEPEDGRLSGAGSGEGSSDLAGALGSASFEASAAANSFARILSADATPFRAASKSTMQSRKRRTAGGAMACTKAPICAPDIRAGPRRQASSKSISGLEGMLGFDWLRLYANAATAPPRSMDWERPVAMRASKERRSMSMGTKRPPPPTPAASEMPAMKKARTPNIRSAHGIAKSGSAAQWPSPLLASAQLACHPQSASLEQVLPPSRARSALASK